MLKKTNPVTVVTFKCIDNFGERYSFVNVLDTDDPSEIQAFIANKKTLSTEIIDTEYSAEPFYIKK